MPRRLLPLQVLCRGSFFVKLDYPARMLAELRGVAVPDTLWRSHALGPAISVPGGKPMAFDLPSMYSARTSEALPPHTLPNGKLSIMQVCASMCVPEKPMSTSTGSCCMRMAS